MAAFEIVHLQNAIKGDVLERFDIFRTPLSQLHNYNIRNGFLPIAIPSRERNGEEGLRVLKLSTIGLPCL